jgi:hypothetical protein
MSELRTPALIVTAFLCGAVLTVGTVESGASGEVASASKKGKGGSSRIVVRARNADRLGGKRPRSYRERCSPQTVRLGSICMMSNPYPLTNVELGRNDYFFATQTCAALGGFLPTAAQLIGAAPYVKLAGRLDDNEVTASTDVDPTDGLKDRREMSSDLTTTASGGRAAGSIGVSDIATGDPKTGEPDPAPMPANPSPETLAYITVYDNHDHGGFGGAEPVGLPMLFRCAFNASQTPGGLP